MKTFLLNWNPDNWDWTDLPNIVDKVKLGQKSTCLWAAGAGRSMRPGDRVFFIQHKREPKGLFGAGRVVRVPRDESNVNVEGAATGKKVLVVDVEIENLVDARNSTIVELKMLRGAPFSEMRWEINSSGSIVKPELAESLEDVWRIKLGKKTGNESETEEGKEKIAEEVKQSKTHDVVKQKEEMAESELIATDKVEQADPMFYAVVSAYFHLLFKSVTGQVYRRRDILAKYAEQLDQLEKRNLDRYFCQLSALLAELGLPFLTENHPWGGASQEMQNALRKYLTEHLDKISNFRRVALHTKEEPPKEIPDSRMFWITPPDPSSYRYSGVPEKLQNLPDALDFLIAETVDRELHANAVDFVLAYEKARLREGGQTPLADKIEKIGAKSRETGCDIISFDSEGDARCILVKPTHFGKHFPFILFNDEIEDLRRGEAEHYIYRPFNLAYEYKLFVLKEGLSEMERTGFDSNEQAVRLITYDRIVFGWPKLIHDNLLGDRFGFVYRT